MKLNNKFAIGCLVQWYEVELIEEYISSLKSALKLLENPINVTIDICWNMSQALEKIDTTKISFDELKTAYYEQAKGLLDGEIDIFLIIHLSNIVIFRANFSITMKK